MTITQRHAMPDDGLYRQRHEEEFGMTFVNEIATPEDKEKYRLDEVKTKYSIHTQSRYGICIDRERDIVLLEIYAGTPRTDDVGRMAFALIVGRHDYCFWLNCTVTRLDDDRRIYSWKLLHIDNAPDSPAELEEIKIIFKEALSVYGYSGPSFWGEKIPAFTAEFDF